MTSGSLQKFFSHAKMSAGYFSRIPDSKKSPAKQTCFVGLLPLPATPDTYCSAANLFTQPYAKKRAAACIQTAALVVA
jgi:hypothetical protein